MRGEKERERDSLGRERERARMCVCVRERERDFLVSMSCMIKTMSHNDTYMYFDVIIPLASFHHFMSPMFDSLEL